MNNVNVETFEAFLKHGEAGGPYLTEQVDVEVHEMWWQAQGLSYTATGYGGKIPSRFKVKVDNGKSVRWYRVYSMCYSNSSVEYITVKGERIFVDINRT